MVGSNFLKMLLFPLVLVLAACGSAAVAGQGGDQTEVPVSQDQAISAALGRLTAGSPGASGVDDPRNPLVRLMTWGEYEERYTTGRSAMDREQLVWVVQVEGMSHSTRCLGPECPEWPYAIAVVDAETGYTFATGRRFEPIFLSTPEPFDPATGGAIPNTRPEKNLVEHPDPDLPLPETELPKGPAEIPQASE